jgi:hypothetical protein
MALKTANLETIDEETRKHITDYVNKHKDFLNRTVSFGSPLQRAKALLFLSIAGG